MAHVCRVDLPGVGSCSLPTKILATPPPQQPQEGGSSGTGPEPLVLPLYAEEWCDELLTRLLALIENIDTGPGANRGTDQGSGATGGEAAGAADFLVKQVGGDGEAADRPGPWRHGGRGSRGSGFPGQAGGRWGEGRGGRQGWLRCRAPPPSPVTCGCLPLLH